MWYPERERKFNVLEEKKKKIDKEKTSLSTEEIQNIKKDFFDKYIKNGELKEQMEGINSAQLSRFYSLLEDRNFYKESNDIKKFIDGQLERAKILGDDSPVGKAKKFYTYYKDNFLKDEDIKDSEKNKIYLTLLKTYFRYILGVERFDEKLK
ncbi:hypothetical protein RN96_06350 [Fusobacterium polymorphum]|uniref:CRISPR type III A-associated protein Csm2 n=1 Tax=Fusobacterium nucleatum subsp. polymorphum TaxID=76857 RepID=A0A2B7YF68_FUSNP|nr:hypothetical protein [Fusobacterium polymorphum]PGH22714.1 hypothetical protein RN96_06350 [Fusobacterium polymorphum]